MEQAHNDYLQVLSDAGIVGLALGYLFYIHAHPDRDAKRSNKEYISPGGGDRGAFRVLCDPCAQHVRFCFAHHRYDGDFLVLLGLVVASGKEYPDDEPDEDQAHAEEKKRKRNIDLRGKTAGRSGRLGSTKDRRPQNAIELIGLYDLTNVARECGLGIFHRTFSRHLRTRLYAIAAVGGQECGEK